MSYIPPKATPQDKEPRLFGMDIQAIIALRAMYQVLGGQMPITAEKVHDLARRWVGGRTPQPSVIEALREPQTPLEIPLSNHP
jgi:hypothetical protein